MSADESPRDALRFEVWLEWEGSAATLIAVFRLFLDARKFARTCGCRSVDTLIADRDLVGECVGTAAQQATNVCVWRSRD